MHIILADDQPQVRSALRLLLEHELEIKQLYEVAHAQALLNCAKTNQPDLILLDWELPGLGEFNLLPALRDCCPGLMIVALSGRLEARPSALAAGVDAFISKGEPPQQLLTLLRTINHIGGYEIMKQELVREWMSCNPITISPKTPLPEAHRLMTEKGIRRLPVTHKGRLVGLVTLGDVREAEPSDATSLTIWEVNSLLDKLEVKRIMTRDLILIAQDAAIHEAAQAMLEHKISGLPVVNEQGELVGIITESDIFRIVVQKWGHHEVEEQNPVLSYA